MKLEALEDQALPEPMVGRTLEEKQAFVQKHKEERERLQKEIQVLTQERDAYVAGEVAETACLCCSSTVSDALSKSIKEEAGKRLMYLNDH